MLPAAGRAGGLEFRVINFITVLNAPGKLHVPQGGEVAFKVSCSRLQPRANGGRRQGALGLEQVKDLLLHVGQLSGLATGFPGSLHRPGITRNGLYSLFQVTVLAPRLSGILIRVRPFQWLAALGAMAHHGLSSSVATAAESFPPHEECRTGDGGAVKDDRLWAEKGANGPIHQG